MSLPSYQPQRLAEGQYTFTISKEPEQRKHSGAKQDFISVTFFFRAEDSNGNVRGHIESLLPWESKYKDVLLAIGGMENEQGEVHLHETEDIVGKSFTAEIVHEEDKKDSSKTWARIANIEPPEGKEEEDVPMPNGNNGENGEPEDEIPF